ncbi:MAG: hypothetical protein KZQ60_10490 [Candidatus Thiodiazotropha sp. (ex Lucinoma aequizonata)]|nr:hypothetical protein [Candidatus Thiodiazotropha sp. (ex Lucinoma aequizonata)]MCU7894604.1 hypothetical protein [Candidatus Thiodiazotropha sp. (ex Lucinoma aequizonata)]MCU7909397.1 hypothetical protein [Candidatus Thiodiazotropha sp. (ex Lucinoma aequizonata)]MCU7913855.1 hypothetical protein [Candidatus Thiodiazotropha sp. (ex Lucinoma aequizonata)]
MDQLLSQASPEFTSSEGRELELPMPYGAMQRFHVEVSPVMAQSLAARYPEICIYRARGVNKPTNSGRIDLTPHGFRAMLSTPSGTVFIDPDEMGRYRSYYKRDYVIYKQGTLSPHVCSQFDIEPVDKQLQTEDSHLAATLLAH